jgi:hypothetical protein
MTFRVLWSRSALGVGLIASIRVIAFAQTGVVAGRVRTGAAVVANARAVLDKAAETRTDSAGRFQFRNVGVGRHALEVLAIGSTPYSVNLIVGANDTLEFEVILVKTVLLDSVVSKGSTVREGFARAYEDRRRLGLGKFLDSLEVRKFASVHQAVVLVPGMKFFKYPDSLRFTDISGLLCRPNFWIDMQNWGTEQGGLGMIRPEDVAAIEIYPRKILLPEEFTARGLDKGCGAVVVWTKRFWPQGKGKP